MLRGLALLIIVLASILIILTGCETEQVIVEKIVYVKDSTSTMKITARSLDSVRTVKPKVDTVYKEVITYELDTVYVTETEYQLDTVWQTITELQIDTVFVEVVRIDTIERENILEYPTYLQSTIDEWMTRVNQKGIILPYMDIIIRMGEPPRIPPAQQTWDFLENGRWVIVCMPSIGEKEINAWRGLSHVMLGKDYIWAGENYQFWPSPGSLEDNLMYQAFPAGVYWESDDKDAYWERMFSNQ